MPHEQNTHTHTHINFKVIEILQCDLQFFVRMLHLIRHDCMYADNSLNAKHQYILAREFPFVFLFILHVTGNLHRSCLSFSLEKLHQINYCFGCDFNAIEIKSES